jgi:predicted kinase
MFRRATELSADGISAALDGTFSTAEALQKAQEVAADSRSLFLAIECVCRSEVAHERIYRRLAEGHDVSDARPELHDIQQMRWQPWTAAIPQVRIDTEQLLDKQVEQIIAALAEKHWPNAAMPHNTPAQTDEPS